MRDREDLVFAYRQSSLDELVILNAEFLLEEDDPEQLTKRMPHAKFVLIPISEKTHGHGTHTDAALWKDHLIELLKESQPAQ